MNTPLLRIPVSASAFALVLSVTACGSTGPMPLAKVAVSPASTLADSLSIQMGDLCTQRLLDLNKRLRLSRVARSVPRDALIEARALRDEAVRQMLIWEYDLALDLMDEAMSLLTLHP